MKLVFFGSPEFAVPSLIKLHKSDHAIKAIVTNKDKCSGRNLKRNQSPVKIIAKNLNYPLLEPIDLSDKEFLSLIKKINADLYVVVAFKILPKSLLNIPSKGGVNLHASLLPRYRGAAPVNHCILNGEIDTGVSTIQMQRNIDTGDILMQQQYKLNDSINTGEVLQDLSYIGADLLLNTINSIEKNKITPKKQDERLITYAPKINASDCKINWNNPAYKIHNQIRAFSPKPGAYTFINDVRMKLYKSQISKIKSGIVLDPGEIYFNNSNLYIGTGTDPIQIFEIQREGKNKLNIKEFIIGHSLISGECFG